MKNIRIYPNSYLERHTARLKKKAIAGEISEPEKQSLVSIVGEKSYQEILNPVNQDKDRLGFISNIVITTIKAKVSEKFIKSL